LQEAAAAARTTGLQLINGVEISVRWQKRTLHIVGLGIDPENPALTTGLQSLQQIRRVRAEQIAAKLEKIGVKNVLPRIDALAGSSQITRSHFARLLIEDGQCKDMKQAFRRYLAAGKPAYVSSEWVDLETAIGWIHAANGLAVLAHPMLYNLSAAWRQRMYLAFTEAGGDALEICCGHSNTQQIEQTTKEALQYGLMGSVGSDFHSEEQRWIQLGKLPALPSALTPVWHHPRLAARLQ